MLSIVACLRSQRVMPNTHQYDAPSNGMTLLGALPVGGALFLIGVQPLITHPVVAPAAGVTADHGNYLVSVSGCRACHGRDLPGGYTSVGPNPIVLVPKWGQADFVNTVHTGVDTSGKSLNPDEMPWNEFSASYTDGELGAIYQYLHGLTPVMKPVQ